MRKYRYTSTNEFKKGDMIWLTGFKLYPSGRICYSIKPVQCEVTQVEGESLTINYPSYNLSFPPRHYFIDTPERSCSSLQSLNANIAKTREEAVENYNLRLIEEIDGKFNDFQGLERRIRGLLL